MYRTLLAVALGVCVANIYAADNAPPDNVEVIVVTPQTLRVPLWQVSNGDHTLWVLAYVSAVPKEIEWDYSQIETIIKNSQEFIGAPSVEGNASPLLYLNPINIVRGVRLVGRLEKNPDGKTLEEVVPSELYQRYLQLKTMYFPKEKDVEEHRPFIVGQEIAQLVYSNNKELTRTPTTMTEFGSVLDRVGKLVKRNRDLHKTDPRAEIELGARYGVLARRAETMMDSLPLEKELACFEHGVASIETREQQLERRERLARAWAYSEVNTLFELSKEGPIDDPCGSALMATSEGDTLKTLVLQSRQQWLDAAYQALMNNASTFAILPLNQFLGDAGLKSELETQGYVIKEPGDQLATGTL